MKISQDDYCLTYPSCQIILLRPNLYNAKNIGNAWFWEEPTYSKWSIEYLYTKELSSSFHIVDCEYKVLDEVPKIPPAQANIIVDADYILKLINV